MLSAIQFFTTGFILGIAILHLVLYLYWRDQKSNLYYSFFLLFLSAAIYTDFQQMSLMDESGLIHLRMQRLFLTLSLLSGLQFFYELFQPNRPSHVYFLIGLLILAGVAAVYEPVQWFLPLVLIIIAVLLDILRLTAAAAQKKKREVWIIGSGFLFFALFASYDILLDSNLMNPFGRLTNGYQFGVMGLIFATSVYLARDISISNRKMVEQEKRAAKQEVKREMLQEEVERTQKELNEARELQLSMLPTELPSTPCVEVAARMRTAAEVGGDYYDTVMIDEHRFDFVIGDATGHGNRAGFMVAIVKSLFKSLQPVDTIPGFFNQVSGILKEMNLGTLFMALSYVKVIGNSVTLSVAGMPPALIYRKEEKKVEEIRLKAMPLGAVTTFPYREETIDLSPGDTILLLTDGLDELFNENREMFGWERIIEFYKEIGEESPEDIIDLFESEAAKWRAEKPIEDDITYLVLKCLK
jgi:serine phosphatase RsbU (regulator of sigma subunit)